MYLALRPGPKAGRVFGCCAGNLTSVRPDASTVVVFQIIRHEDGKRFVRARLIIFSRII